MRIRIVTAWLTLALMLTGTAGADLYAPPATYYDTATGTGTTLKNQLHNIIDGHTVLSYDSARTNLQVTDRDPNDSGSIILVYDNTSLDVSGFTSGIPGWDGGASWNREHVWPRSRGVDESGADNSDLHILRPADPGTNADRLNFNFGGAFGQSFGLVNDGGTHWYPGDADAGMIARQAFYMAVRYDGSDSNTEDLELTNGNPGAFGTTMGKLSRLIEWHYAAPPAEFERRRNDVIYNNYQGNRNPFVDRPGYVWSVFVDQNNDSRVTILGGTVGSDASETSRSLDFGVGLVGSTPTLNDQNVVLLKNGSDGTYYDVRTTGSATSTNEGSFNSFITGTGDNTTISIGMSPDTASAGLKTGTVTIDNLDVTLNGGVGRGGNDLDDVVTTTYTVLDNAFGSFNPATEQPTLSLDFGEVPQGSSPAALPFDIYNIETTPGFTAALDIDTPTPLGSNVFDVTGLTGTVPAGGSIQPVATIDTTNLGTFGGTWLIAVSDPDLPGEQTRTLVLSLSGEVVAALLPGDTDGDGDIDDADLGTAFANYTGPVGSGGGKTAAQGDTDADGDIDDADLGTAFSGFTGPLTPTNVPEPAAALVLISMLLSRGRPQHHRRAVAA